LLPKHSESANSQSIATILLIAITLLLALLVLLLFHLPPLEWGSEPPVIIEIRGIYHSDQPSGALPNFDSRIILFHAGSTPFENDLLEARIYRGGNLLNCRISTLNGHNFISTHHFGVQTISGTGCQDTLWKPGEKIAIDLSDNTLHPGDVVQVDIREKPGGTVISRDTKKA
jgi:hypothetical protein